MIDFIDLASIATAPQLIFPQRVLRYTQALFGFDPDVSADCSVEFTGSIDDPIPIREKGRAPVYAKSKAASLLTLNFPELAQAHDYCEAAVEAKEAAAAEVRAKLKDKHPNEEPEIPSETLDRLYRPVLEHLNRAMELVQQYDTVEAWTLKVRILTERLPLKTGGLQDTPGAIDDCERLFQVAELLASKGTFLSVISTSRQESWRVRHFEVSSNPR